MKLVSEFWSNSNTAALASAQKRENDLRMFCASFIDEAAPSQLPDCAGIGVSPILANMTDSCGAPQRTPQFFARLDLLGA
jgi:hypothetical protein